MRYIKHISMMIFGYFLYLLTFKLFDLPPDNRFFMWSLPYVGYQRYHPPEMSWWQPFESI